MRRASLFAVGVVAVLAGAAAALWLARAPILEFAIARAMAGAGFDHPSVRLVGLGPDYLALAQITAGADASAPDLSIEHIGADFSLGDLVFKQRVGKIVIDKGNARALIGEDGALSLAGWRPDPSARPAPPFFDQLSLSNFDLIAVTPEGPATASVAGVFSLKDGGLFDVAFDAPRAGFSSAALADMKGSATVTLLRGGEVSVQGAVTGDIVTASGIARNIDADLSAALTSWRGAFGDGPRGLYGKAGARVKSSTLDAAEMPSLAAIPAAGAAPVKSLSVKGSIAADFSADGVTVRLDDGPVTLTADRGDELTVTGGEDGLVYEARGKSGRAMVMARLAGPVASGEGAINAVTEDGERWTIDADAALKEQTIAGVAIAGLAAAFTGDAADQKVTGRLSYDGLVRHADIGRLKVADMPAAGALDIAVDFETRTATAAPPADECLRVDRASFRLPDQDIDARLTLAQFCAAEGAALAIIWGGGGRVRLAGALRAMSVRARMGRTDFVGAPPGVRFTLDYEPAANATRASGAFSGGDGVLTRTLKLSKAAGVYEAALAGEALAATATLSTLTIAQAADLELVAPVVVAGQASLKNDRAAFAFDVNTPRGAGLGRGEGTHDMKSGKGEAVFDSGDLVFAPGGLQPDGLIPALRGIISSASGSSGGKAAFAWTPTGVTSSGSAVARDVSFQGPGVAVTRTEGVTGDLSFSNLMPVATAGEQTVSIRKIDLDALDLENGAMRFALPGDDTLRIIEAEFPWFGGTIGAYTSTMALSGATSETRLQIDNVSLAELLGFFNVEGLSGEGVIEGVLPITFEGARARIDGGVLSAKGAGVIRYTGDIAGAAGQTNASTELAFEALREFRYEALSTTIDGALDGTLVMKVAFEGRSNVTMKSAGEIQTVYSPFIFRVSIKGPLLNLINQAAVSVNVRRQIEDAARAAKEKPE